MTFFRKIITVQLIVGLLPFYMIAQQIGFKQSDSFYSDLDSEDDIIWGQLEVPENWEKPDDNHIKIAVAVLKSEQVNNQKKAIVFIQGGPGARGIQNLGYWKNHDLRAENDIVLFDLRGTGFSEPRLCPELGNKMLQILAKNQVREKDEKQKINAAIVCQQQILEKGIDIQSYSSLSVAQDLHFMKEELGYSSWTVYGVSYGTYMAQVYAHKYQEDIKFLLLDSVIVDIQEYVENNTSNYMNSLLKVFADCKANKDCNTSYPNLEKIYYEVINDLETNPIIADVSKDVIDKGVFAFNAEDFKIAVHQSLYNKKMIEVLPLLIYQFKKRNQKALGNLVTAFANLLGMDYGVYYSFSCNEVLPNNNITSYNKDVSLYPRLKGGLAFYESDFGVCKIWSSKQGHFESILHNTSGLLDTQFPILVFSGGYDPITPTSNAKKLQDNLKNVTWVKASAFGHVPSLTSIGTKVILDFMKSPEKKPDATVFDKVVQIDFVDQVIVNPGVAKMGLSFSEFDAMLFFPLGIAFLVLLTFVVVYTYGLLKNRYSGLTNKIARVFMLITSIVGVVTFLGFIIALLKTGRSNSFILAFGLPDNFQYLFTILILFGVLLAITLCYFFIRSKNIDDKSIVFSVLFSNLLIFTYFFYWGVI